MSASRVAREPEFDDDLAYLRRRYPQIDEVVEEFCDVLRSGYDLPQRPIDRLLPNTYSVNLDYPPLEEHGLAHFQITYHQSADNPWPVTPFRTFTLLTLIERKK